jgi:hypothetical protein
VAQIGFVLFVGWATAKQQKHKALLRAGARHPHGALSLRAMLAHKLEPAIVGIEADCRVEIADIAEHNG